MASGAGLAAPQGIDTLVAALEWQAAHNADRTAYVFWDGEQDERSFSYLDVRRRAREVGHFLQTVARPGDRVVLVFDTGIDFITSYYGCQYGGLIPVPVYPPAGAKLEQAVGRLVKIVQDADPAVVLAPRDFVAMASNAAEAGLLPKVGRWIAVEDIPVDGAGAFVPSTPAAADTAFLQYTSGSTSNPRGVIVTHGNLVQNCRMIADMTERAVGPGELSGRAVVSWLPLYHDMGLIGMVLAPMLAGVKAVLFSPLLFLQRPLRWLQAITRHRAVATGAPNFAYEYTARRVTDADLASLDLSSLALCCNGAEPISVIAVRAFLDRFAQVGLRRNAVVPAYGLAEATLLVSAAPFDPADALPVSKAAWARGELVPAEDAHPPGDVQPLVSVGPPAASWSVRIVDPASLRPLPDAEVGEIWLSGPCAGRGYWRREQESEEHFRSTLPGEEGHWLRTGDLGVLREGRLYIAGRLKDLIIIAGKNHYPQEIEESLARIVPGLRPNCLAAFAVPQASGAAEGLVVVAEVDRRAYERRRAQDPVATDQRQRSDRRASAPTGEEPLVPAPFDRAAVLARMRQVLSSEHGLSAQRILLVAPSSVPKTSSGKLQRALARRLFLDGRFEELGT